MPSAFNSRAKLIVRQNQTDSLAGIKYRKLRIAWSVLCGILCALVAIIWVRSYRWFDEFAILNSRSLMSAQSTYEGVLYLSWGVADPELSAQYYSRLFNTRPRDMLMENNPSKAGKFDSYFSPSVWYVALPCWFLFITLGTLAGLLWFRWRYSLRTLLIVTTLVAVGLGWTVYTFRN
jgi:hypothetical protein